MSLSTEPETTARHSLKQTSFLIHGLSNLSVAKGGCYSQVPTINGVLMLCPHLEQCIYVCICVIFLDKKPMVVSVQMIALYSTSLHEFKPI